MRWDSSSVVLWDGTHVASFLRKPFSALTSLGGTPKHPAWLHNLWPRLVEHDPAFAGSQARTEREIPVVVLSPRG